MALTNEEIIEALKEKSLLEASELVKMIEDTFGVSAAAPAAAVLHDPAESRPPVAPEFAASLKSPNSHTADTFSAFSAQMRPLYGS